MNVVSTVLVVVFGATGDLFWRKLAWALSEMDREFESVVQLQVLACGSADLSDDEFRAQVEIKMAREPWFNRHRWNRFVSHVHYVVGRSSEKEGMDAIARKVRSMRTTLGFPNELYYCALPPDAYAETLKQLRRSGLVAFHPKEQIPWQRVVLEKPLGLTPTQASENLEELEITVPSASGFLVDHWAGKASIIPGIPVYRYGNKTTEPSFNHQHVSRVHVSAIETVGVIERAAFSGAVLDMLASHLGLVYCLLRVGCPSSFQVDYVPRLVSSAQELVIDPSLIIDVQLAQYTAGITPVFDPATRQVVMKKVKGYLEEAGSRADLCTAARVTIAPKGDRWQRETPFILEAVKRGDCKFTGWVVSYRPPSNTLFDNMPLEGGGFGLWPNAYTNIIEEIHYERVGDGTVVPTRISGDVRTHMSASADGTMLRPVVSRREELLSHGDGYKDMLLQIVVPKEHQPQSALVPRWFPPELQMGLIQAFSDAQAKTLES